MDKDFTLRSAIPGQGSAINWSASPRTLSKIYGIALHNVHACL